MPTHFKTVVALGAAGVGCLLIGAFLRRRRWSTFGSHQIKKTLTLDELLQLVDALLNSECDEDKKTAYNLLNDAYRTLFANNGDFMLRMARAAYVNSLLQVDSEQRQRLTREAKEHVMRAQELGGHDDQDWREWFEVVSDAADVLASTPPLVVDDFAADSPIFSCIVDGKELGCPCTDYVPVVKDCLARSQRQTDDAMQWLQSLTSRDMDPDSGFASATEPSTVSN